MVQERFYAFNTKAGEKGDTLSLGKPELDRKEKPKIIYCNMVEVCMKVSDFIWCGTVPEQSTLVRASKIKLLLMDVDGVLTDGRIYYLPGSDGVAYETKGFTAHDGLAFNFLNEMGIKTGFISGRRSQAVEEYAANKKVSYVYQGNLDKKPILAEILGKAALKEEEFAYIGDDFTDMPILSKAGLSCTVADARQEVKEICHFITQARGGEGAVREVIELILKARGDWPKLFPKLR